MNRTLVLNVVGLTPKLLGEATPNLSKLAREGGMRPLRTVLPAVTSTVHATFTTGALPRDHGAVANGWYHRDTAEIRFWLQSNHLVQGEKVWDAGRRIDPSFTTAKLFFWFNMYSTADWSVTPRPMYPADGRKIPDIYAEPPELRFELTEKLGRFPLFNFWGPELEHRLEPVDRRLREVRLWQAPSDAHAGLPPAPGLRASEARPERPGDREGPGRDRRGLRRPDRARATGRHARHRRFGVRDHGGPRRDLHQPGPAGGGAAAGEGGARAGAARRRRVGGVRRRRPPGRPRVREATGAGRRGEAAPGAGRRDRGRAGRAGEARGRARPSALGRARGRLAGGPVVRLLPLVRRRPRARLRAHRRHPSQARLRPGRAFRGSAAPVPEVEGGVAAVAEDARVPLPAGHHPAGRIAGAGLARPAHGRPGGRPGLHHERARSGSGGGRRRR